MSFIFFTLSYLLTLVLSHQDYEYGMVIDAGSTHSQLYIYRWEYRETSTSISPRSFPEEIASSNSTSPGISTCCSTYEEIRAHLKGLISFAENQLSSYKSNWDSYPIYLKATAGMRILSESQRETLLSWINTAFSNSTVNPFLYNSNQGIIIAGEEEGLFGWMTVNYAKGILSRIIDNENTQTTPSKSYGALDMGGQSLQISFAPQYTSDILANFFTLQLWQNNYRIYTHSYLTYGTNGWESQLAQAFYDYFYDENKINQTIYNPCLMTGYNKQYNITNNNGKYEYIYQIGNNTGYPTLCTKITEELLYNETECFTGEGSCAINGVYQPDINENITFYAFSSFYYTIIPMGLANDTSLYEILQVIDELSTISYAEFEVNTTYGEALVSSGQFTNYGYNKYLLLIYIYQLLGNAFKFPINNTNIIYADSIGNTSLGWAQGSIVRDVNWQYYKLTKDNGLTNKGKAYQISTLILGIVCGLQCIGLVVLAYKAKLFRNLIGGGNDKNDGGFELME